MRTFLSAATLATAAFIGSENVHAQEPEKPLQKLVEEMGEQTYNERQNAYREIIRRILDGTVPPPQETMDTLHSSAKNTELQARLGSIQDIIAHSPTRIECGMYPAAKLCKQLYAGWNVAEDVQHGMNGKTVHVERNAKHTNIAELLRYQVFNELHVQPMRDSTATRGWKIEKKTDNAWNYAINDNVLVRIPVESTAHERWVVDSHRKGTILAIAEPACVNASRHPQTLKLAQRDSTNIYRGQNFGECSCFGNEEFFQNEWYQGCFPQMTFECMTGKPNPVVHAAIVPESTIQVGKRLFVVESMKVRIDEESENTYYKVFFREEYVEDTDEARKRALVSEFTVFDSDANRIPNINICYHNVFRDCVQFSIEASQRPVTIDIHTFENIEYHTENVLLPTEDPCKTPSR